MSSTGILKNNCYGTTGNPLSFPLLSLDCIFQKLRYVNKGRGLTSKMENQRAKTGLK